MPRTGDLEPGSYEVELIGPCALVLDEKSKTLPRARQVYKGLVWILSRNPSCGAKLALKSQRIPTADVYMVKTSTSQHVPTVRAIYLVEGMKVTIVKLMVFEAGKDPVL